MMKKIFTLALTLMVSVFVCTNAVADKKKAKKVVAKAEQTNAPLKPVTSADSLSYAVGMAQTQGLLPYLVQELKVDSAYLPSFVDGLKASMEAGNDPKAVAYAAGQQIAGMLKTRIIPAATGDFEGTPDSIRKEHFLAGFVAGVLGDASVYTVEESGKLFSDSRKRIVDAKNEAVKKENADWLAENAKKDGVVTLPDGLQYKVLVKGNGAKPTEKETVKVRYEGKMIDGTVFDSSYKREPNTTEFRCDQVIKGWTEALTMMPVGSKWEVYIPQELAYGSRQAGQIKPYSTLIFTIELVDITKHETTTAAETKPVVKAQAKKTNKRK